MKLQCALILPRSVLKRILAVHNNAKVMEHALVFQWIAMMEMLVHLILVWE
jgi:hypothetical protein